jgi:hypothetical protein
MIYLLNPETLELRRKNKYSYLHIGLVQVVVKPLYRWCINSPICLLLRDSRHLGFNNNLLVVLESNTANGPVYFNHYPISL